MPATGEAAAGTGVRVTNDVLGRTFIHRIPGNLFLQTEGIIGWSTPVHGWFAGPFVPSDRKNVIGRKMCTDGNRPSVLSTGGTSDESGLKTPGRVP